MTYEYAWKLIQDAKVNQKPIENDTLNSMLGVADWAMGFDDARNAAVCIYRLVYAMDRLNQNALAAEREACAKIAESHNDGDEFQAVTSMIAEEIRARTAL